MSDEEWAFCAPYQTLMREDAPQREHSLRSLFTGLRSLVRGLPRDTESVLVWRTGLGRVVRLGRSLDLEISAWSSFRSWQR